MLHLGWAGLVQNVGRMCNDGVTLSQTERREEVAKSQVRSSIVNSLSFPGENQCIKAALLFNF